MKLSQDYVKYTSQKILFTSPPGQFICDGKVVNRRTLDVTNYSGVSTSLSELNSTVIQSLAQESKKIKTHELNEVKNAVQKSPVSSLKNYPRVPEIVMFSKSSSHYPVEPPQYLYLNNGAVNNANKIRADEINLHRRVFFDDGNQNVPKSEHINRIWFPTTKRFRSLEKTVR